MAASAKTLADLAHQMATTVDAGIPLLRSIKLLSREGPVAVRRALRDIHHQVASGTPLAVAMGKHGEVFPPLFVALVGVGEHVGALEKTLQALSNHYQLRYELNKSLISSLIYPAFMFITAGAIVILLIVIRDGLVMGKASAVPHAIGFATVWYGSAVGLVGGYLLIRSRLGGFRPLDEFLLTLPVVGKAIRNLESAQFCWILQISLEAGIGVLDGLRLAVDSSRNAAFRGRLQNAPAMVANGTPVSEALTKSGFFRTVVLAAVEVGESAGRLPETLSRLSRSAMEEAETSLRMLAKTAGWVIWAIVALLIISIIFQLASQYVGMLNSLSSG